MASAPLTIETPVAAGFSPGPGLPILTLSAPAKVLDLLALHCHGWERGPGGEPAAVRCVEDAEGFVIEAAVLPLGRYRAEDEPKPERQRAPRRRAIGAERRRGAKDEEKERLEQPSGGSRLRRRGSSAQYAFSCTKPTKIVSSKIFRSSQRDQLSM
ncbi:MAG TPA: hypothetical protein VLE26_01080 [Alphaproteobacteria bacterium]|nr:hypothetical protein [Alphaproteobacteria bacterium]